MKIKLTWKIWLWIIVLILSLISIFITPNFLKKGALITNIDKNSSLFEEGLRQGDIIIAIDSQKIENSADFSRIISEKFPLDKEAKTIITTSKSDYILYSKAMPEISVADIPKSNLKLGLDLVGGSRALIKAENQSLSKSDVDDLIQITSNRFNEYGLKDMKVLPVSDLTGNNYMSIEIAGATPEDLRKLISEQGKFEAKIGNETLFVGGKKDITSVSRSGQESGIYSCNPTQEGYYCNFRFTIYLSQEAAEKHANITKNLETNSSLQGEYLSKTLDLYVDDKLVDKLLIGADLKGRVTTQVQISGSGTGQSKSDAIADAESEMKHLQTILITGSLPFKLQVVKLDVISPTLGESFTKYILLAGLFALISVGIIVFIRYRSKSSLAPLIICSSEIFITLGIATIFQWDLDLPSIAGILAAIGTGVDDQIVILDEAKHKEEALSISQKIKRAFAIVLGAYLASVVSLLPLWWAGAGLLKGFVFTTVTGITIGVLITRRAFADIVRLTENK